MTPTDGTARVHAEGELELERDEFANPAVPQPTILRNEPRSP